MNDEIRRLIKNLPDSQRDAVIRHFAEWGKTDPNHKIPTISSEEARELGWAEDGTWSEPEQLPKWLADLIKQVNDVPRRSNRGRKDHERSEKPRTADSYQAAIFVNSEITTFKKRNSLKRVSQEITDLFIELARQMYPAAKPSIVREHLRERKKTFFWLK